MRGGPCRADAWRSRGGGDAVGKRPGAAHQPVPDPQGCTLVGLIGLWAGVSLHAGRHIERSRQFAAGCPHLYRIPCSPGDAARGCAFVSAVLPRRQTLARRQSVAPHCRQGGTRGTEIDLEKILPNGQARVGLSLIHI